MKAKSFLTLKGSIKKVNFRENKRQGQIIQNKPLPKNRNTEKQVIQREKYKRLLEIYKKYNLKEYEYLIEKSKKENLTSLNIFLKLYLKIMKFLKYGMCYGFDGELNRITDNYRENKRNIKIKGNARITEDETKKRILKIDDIDGVAYIENAGLYLENFTVNILTRTQQEKTQGGILSCSNYNNFNELLIFNQNNIEIYINDDRVLISNINIVNKNWTLITLSNNYKAGELKLYINGELKNKIYTKRKVNIEGIVLGQEQDEYLGGYDTKQAYLGDYKLMVWDTKEAWEDTKVKEFFSILKFFELC